MIQGFIRIEDLEPAIDQAIYTPQCPVVYYRGRKTGIAYAGGRVIYPIEKWGVLPDPPWGPQPAGAVGYD